MLKPLFAGACVACLSNTLGGCGEPPPPRSVEYFMREAPALHATLLRCRDPGFDTADDPDCANARRAADTLRDREAEAGRAQREAELERNRAALRRGLALERLREHAPREEEAIESPPEDDRGPAPETKLSDAALEAEIRRLQEELARRRRDRAQMEEAPVTGPPPD